jgi:ribonuclease-3
MAVNFAKLEKIIGIKFKKREFLKEALTHRSFLNEKPNRKLKHNERLEFLGDAVLELIVTEYLYKKYPDKPEGELTNFRAALVKASSLFQVSSDLGLNNFLLLSKGEAKDLGKARQFILADALEALIGAIYLDRGYEAARSFIEKKILVPQVAKVKKEGLRDAKSLFQEKAQEIEGVTPVYKIISDWGPDHNKHFITGVYLGDKLIAEGEGSSKQEAHQSAAEMALKKRKWD